MTWQELARNEFAYKPKAIHGFLMLVNKLGEEPTLEQFEKATGLKKSSYYRVRKEYRESQKYKNPQEVNKTSDDVFIEDSINDCWFF